MKNFGYISQGNLSRHGEFLYDNDSHNFSLGLFGKRTLVVWDYKVISFLENGKSAIG